MKNTTGFISGELYNVALSSGTVFTGMFEGATDGVAKFGRPVSAQLEGEGEQIQVRFSQIVESEIFMSAVAVYADSIESYSLTSEMLKLQYDDYMNFLTEQMASIKAEADRRAAAMQ